MKYAGGCLLIFTAMILLPRNTFAQLFGSVSLMGYHTNNVEARDTATPDNIFSPSIAGGYKFSVMDHWSLTTDVYFQPQWYLIKPDRSNIYGTFSLTTRYLFDVPQETSSMQVIHNDPLSVAVSELQKIRHIGESLGAKLPNQNDILSIIDGLNDVMQAEGFTESMKEVIIEELEAVKVKLSQQRDTSRFLLILARLRESIGVIRALTAEPDALFVGAATAGSTRDQRMNVTDDDELNPLYTLYNGTDIARRKFSHSRILFLEDLYPKWAMPLQQSLEIPISFEFQRNSATYDGYSYNAFITSPTLLLYPSRSVSLSFTYEYGLNSYFNDTSQSYQEHNFWIEARTVAASSLLIIGSAGIGYRSYPQPLRIEELISIRPPRYFVRESQATFSKFSLGGGLIWFIGDRFFTSIVAKKTISPTVDSPTYIVEFRQGTQYAGKLSNDDFSYEKSGGVFTIGVRTPADIDWGFTADYENRIYPNTFLYTPAQQGNPRPTSASKFISSDSRMFGIFSSFYPTLSVTYTNISSTIHTYSYDDLRLSADMTWYF
jgi:hypothetical protein